LKHIVYRVFLQKLGGISKEKNTMNALISLATTELEQFPSNGLKWCCRNIKRMERIWGDIQLIEKQIERLDDKAFAELAAWFADYENSRWDRQIEADSYTGKFDAFMEEALTEHRNGKTTPL
jgi:hypothetical protein